VSVYMNAALAYAQRGWRVVPSWPLVEVELGAGVNGGAYACSCPRGVECGKNSGKHPRLRGWQDVATCADDIVRLY